MKDKFSREISYLRISITEKCNLCCTYCMGDDLSAEFGNEAEAGETLSADENRALKAEKSPEWEGREGELTPEEIAEITEAAVSLGIRKVRITGGEPLVRPDVVEVCEKIHAIPGVEELTLTTNGILLKEYAKKLKAAGVSRLNISLDTLDQEKYRQITRWGSLRDVLDGIEAARDVDLAPIKINVVLLKNFNEDEIVSFVELTRKEPIEVRFIELMPIGAGIGRAEQYLPGEMVLQKVPELTRQEDSGVACLYRLVDGVGRVGLIRPVSRHFCPACNRIRLTSDGHLRPCLHSSEEIDIRHLHGAALREAIKQAILCKPMEHEDFSGGKVSGSTRGMNQIGG